MINEILEHFPSAGDGNGGVDRKKLSKIVFHDALELEALNAITHRYILTEVRKWLRKSAMDGYSCAVIDAVELIAGGLKEYCDYTIAVLAPRERRIQRIMQRDGLDKEHAEQRVAAQKNDEYYISNCTYVVYNNTGTKAFWNELNEIYRRRK